MAEETVAVDLAEDSQIESSETETETIDSSAVESEESESPATEPEPEPVAEPEPEFDEDLLAWLSAEEPEAPELQYAQQQGWTPPPQQQAQPAPAQQPAPLDYDALARDPDGYFGQIVSKALETKGREYFEQTFNREFAPVAKQMARLEAIANAEAERTLANINSTIETKVKNELWKDNAFRTSESVRKLSMGAIQGMHRELKDAIRRGDYREMAYKANIINDPVFVQGALLLAKLKAGTLDAPKEPLGTGKARVESTKPAASDTVPKIDQATKEVLKAAGLSEKEYLESLEAYGDLISFGPERGE